MQIINGYLKLLAYSHQNTYVIISQTMTSIINRVTMTQQFHLLSKVSIMTFSCILVVAILYVTRFAKRVLIHAQLQDSLSWPFDRHNNRLTVHAYTSAKASTVYFYWGLIFGPVWCPWVLGRSVNGSNLTGQADSRQGITTRLVGETGHQHVELKTAWIEAIWP